MMYIRLEGFCLNDISLIVEHVMGNHFMFRQAAIIVSHSFFFM